MMCVQKSWSKKSSKVRGCKPVGFVDKTFIAPCGQVVAAWLAPTDSVQEGVRLIIIYKYFQERMRLQQSWSDFQIKNRVSSLSYLVSILI